MTSGTSKDEGEERGEREGGERLRPSDLTVSLEVQPRKPRLAWQGMERREAAVSVPTQVVEIVRPGKAQGGDDLLPGITAGQQRARGDALPPNRLIWTNDNLVALQTLLDERDPLTRDYRYRGKVDLIYIDPPFMVQADFVADNAIDVDLDQEAHVSARKEPSLVEILAYKDTWRQGLDSFLSSLRERLVLLRELLSQTGNICVHLDWHAAHYVKVLMDDLFGYENFVNEIIWQRTTGKSLTTRRLPANHDVIFHYGKSTQRYWNHDAAFVPYDTDNLDEKTVSKYSHSDPDGRVYRLDNLVNPNPARPNLTYEFLGVTRVWRWAKDRMEQAYKDGIVVQTKPGTVPQLKRYLDEQRGRPIGDLWTDINPINSQAHEALDYPTQKPVSLLERVVEICSPPSGLVLDCYAGAGTTCEVAERLGRRWIGSDNSKYAIHLTRKRLIGLHNQRLRAAGSDIHVRVAPFTVENMGVYQRAEQWQDFQRERSRYRDEMIKVFGGEVVSHSPLLHGRKGNSWVHVGPLDGPVSVAQVWSIAREAQRTDRKTVTILSADFDTLSASEKDEIKDAIGVAVIIRIIPASAIDEVRRRLQILHANPEAPVESMAIPAFYSPLSIVLSHQIKGRMGSVTLERCEVDIESFLASQRPVLKPMSSAKTAAATKKLKAEYDKWEARQKELEAWLAKATSWKKFIDFWAVDWDYGRRVGEDGKPIFETDWQSFRVRKSKNELEPLVFTAEQKYTEPGHYRVAARVTDVFGNDGIATVIMEVK